jgi:hypothetical protein
LAFILIAVTIVCAIIYEVKRRREQARVRAEQVALQDE